MNIKLNYLLILLLVVSLAGNFLFYFKIGELEEKIQEISQYKDQSSPVVENENQDQNDNITYKTFSSPKADFTFEYPSDWVYDEEEISAMRDGKEIKTMAWGFYPNLEGNYDNKPPYLTVYSPAVSNDIVDTLDFYSTNYNCSTRYKTKFPYQLNTFPTNDPETYVTYEQGDKRKAYIYWRKGESFANAYCIGNIYYKFNLMIFYGSDELNELERQKVAQHIAKSIKIEISNKENTTLWQEYTNHQLGFSIKFPQIVYGINRCSDETIWVPVKIFEDNDNGIVFIVEEYHYDNWNEKLQTNTSPCKKITYSLESLREDITEDITPIFEFKAMPKPWLGLAVMIKNINNDIELNKFIKDNYGPGCFAGKKELWKQEEVYEIRIEGEDWRSPGKDLGTTTCPINWVYKILYAPEKNKVMSVDLGQECTFGTDPSAESFKCYDYEMIDSFIFE